jgi:hypothetical protein
MNRHCEETLMTRKRLLLWGAIALMTPMASLCQAQGVEVVITPAELTVHAGEEFDLDVAVAGGSDPFNAFELVIEFDPSALHLISNQEGPLMTDACGARFHYPEEGNGLLSVTDALLCSGVEVSGPGVIYSLGFRARGPAGSTTVHIRSAGFSNGGINIAPVTTSDAVMQITDVVTGLPDDPVGPRLHAPYPNPFSNSVHLGFTAGQLGPVRLEVYTIIGQRVRALISGEAGPLASSSLTWDGRDDAGRAVPDGLYLVRLVTAQGVHSRRIAKVR